MNLVIPEIKWHVELKTPPDHQGGDEAYIKMLEDLTEKGVPIPIRVWTRAAGIDLDEMLQSLEDDRKLREKLKKG